MRPAYGLGLGVVAALVGAAATRDPLVLAALLVTYAGLGALALANPGGFREGGRTVGAFTAVGLFGALAVGLAAEPFAYPEALLALGLAWFGYAVGVAAR